jgi:hypothetical protein
MTSSRHLIYDLCVETNAPLFHLSAPVDDSDARPDVSVSVIEWQEMDSLLAASEWLPDPDGATGEPDFSMFRKSSASDPLYLFRFLNCSGGRADCLINSCGSSCKLAWSVNHIPQEEAFKAVRELTNGRILGYILRLRKILCLHGSVVASDSGAIGFIGEGGSGKSTLAAMFLAKGYSLVADDRIVATLRSERFHVHPGRPAIRLWPESLPLLNIDKSEFPTVYSGNDKRFLSLEDQHLLLTGKTANSHCPLSALYILAPRDACMKKPAITPLSRVKALKHLMQNRYGFVIPPRDCVASEYEQIARLVRSIPVKMIQRPDDLTCLPELLELIENDLCITPGNLCAHPISQS